MKNMNQNWDSYKRKSANLNKAVENNLLFVELIKIYNVLIKNFKCIDIFNDTVIKLTYKYNPNIPLYEQFSFYYNQLKGEYFRDNKVTNYLIQSYADYQQINEEE